VEMGWITIYLEESSLIIKNKGTSETIYQDWVFKRNKANYKSKGTLGLGLTIVRRITKIYNFHVQYAQNENIHTVILTFSPSSQSEITGEKLS
jgi:signal transduction histidine kinase